MNDMSKFKKGHQEAADQYLAALCELWASYTHTRNKGDTGSELLDWIRSTIRRDSFSTALIRARIVKEPYTCSELANLLNVSRQSIHAMLVECTDKGWIRCFVNGKMVEKSQAKNHEGTMKYDAGDEMLSYGRAFIPRQLEALKKFQVQKRFQLLNDFERSEELMNELEISGHLTN